MAITNATSLADFGTGIGTEGATLTVDNTTDRIGIGTASPEGMLQVGTAITMGGNTGIITAVTYNADSNLNVGSAVTVVGATGVVSATTYYGENINSDTLLNKAGTGAPTLTYGAQLPVGYGITGAGSINVSGAITATDATFTGTLTYEDVTNVDSVGLITARSGLKVTAGGLNVIGVATIGTGLSFTDDIKAKFGASGDLEIYHDGSNSYIKDVGTGELKITGSVVTIY